MWSTGDSLWPYLAKYKSREGEIVTLLIGLLIASQETTRNYIRLYTWPLKRQYLMANIVEYRNLSFRELTVLSAVIFSLSLVQAHKELQAI